LLDIEKYLHGKSIVVVGNASSLIFRNNHGEFVDQHDVVVRLNKYLTHPNCGFKTDIVALSLHGIQVLPEVKHIMWMTPKKITDIRDPRQYIYSSKLWKSLYEKLQHRPSTGCMVCDLLANILNLSIDVVGFDFWQSPTTYTGEIRPGPHSPNVEKSYLRSIKNINFQ